MRTIKELEREWKINKETLKYWCRTQYIPARKIGGIWIIADDVQKPQRPPKGRKKK